MTPNLGHECCASRQCWKTRVRFHNLAKSKAFLSLGTIGIALWSGPSNGLRSTSLKKEAARKIQKAGP